MITVVIPVYNEQDNIAPLVAEILAVSAPITEIIYVNDGSTDGTGDILEKLRLEVPILRVVQHSVRCGQSAAFMSGVRAARNTLIVFMDGDGQNDPKDIPALLDAYKNIGGRTMICGQRMKRQDNWIRRISSGLANRIRGFILGDRVADTGCSLKLVRREDYLALPYFNHMHRFLPALLLRDHVAVLSVPVSHRPRARGVSKYGFWDRLWVGMFDLVGVRWLLCRGLPHDFTAKEIV